MLYVDVKYANLLSGRLRNYKHKGDYLWNFSCPVCGDSSKNKTKARGYIYRVKTGLFVKCHNCGYGSNIGNLIKHLDTNLYEEYVLENYKEGGAPHTPHKSVEIAVPDLIRNHQPSADVLLTIKKLSDLSEDHPAVKYIQKRQIPTRFLDKLYFAPKFKKFVNLAVPGKFKMESNEHPRLIIPYFDLTGRCFAFQGRAFGKEDPKYYTIKLDDTAEKIFGLERLDQTSTVYITEGPLDSLFIPNAIAVSGSSFHTPLITKLKQKAVVVYDNEPRSKELTNLIEKTIADGFSVCLWPDTVIQKDINEMILAGQTSQEIVNVINSNTYSGAEAILRFATWRRC